MYTSFLDSKFDDEKLIVTRTFSKVYGLAGLRGGYAVASANVVKRMQDFANDDNINQIAIEAVLAALEDTNALDAPIQRNADGRQEFFNQAMARALKPIDSHANFVMMNTFHPTQNVIQHFSKNNVLIGRPFPPMDTYIRVSLGTPNEMLRFWQVWDALPWAKNLMHQH